MNGYDELFVASDDSALRLHIEALDDMVAGPRNRPRKRVEERWIVKRYLQSLDIAELTPPVTLFHATRDKSPDFILDTAAGTLAVEVTELIPPHVAKKWATDTNSEPTLGPSYVGNQPERTCAELMVQRLTAKFASFACWDNRSSHRNILLVYEDTTLPDLRMDEVFQITQENLAVSRPLGLEVFILHNEEWHGLE